MSYQLKNTGKSSVNNNSSGEALALRKGISASSVPALQMKKQAAQLMAEEEEPLQGKFETVQRAGIEEEEPMQGKFDPIQKVEEEEPLQGKFEPVQRAGMEEEEPLQRKFDPVQKVEEEEPLQGKFDPVQRAGMEEEEPLQGKFDPVQKVEEEEPLQGKFDPVQRAGMEDEEPLQGKFAKGPATPFQLKSITASGPAIQKKDEGGSPNNTGMPSHLKSGIESLSGFSMDDVKVHYNSDKPKQLKAHAYAQGTNIHIAPGQEQHLPHEAWHVAQQKQGRVQATMQMKGNVPVNDDTGLETEADVMGAKAAKVGIEMSEPGALNHRTAAVSATQRVAQLRPATPPAPTPPSKQGIGLLAPGATTVEEEASKKSETEQDADSFVDSYGGAQGATADFLTSGPVSFTNKNNTKLDDDGKTVVDEDKAVASGHKSDPLGKGASAAGVGVGLYTGIFGMYQAVQKFREGEVNDKIEGVFAMLTSTSTTVKSGADITKTVSKEGSDKAATAAKTSSITGTVTDGIDAVKSLVLTIKGIYDAYQDASSTEGSSTQEKLQTGMATVRGLVEAAGKAVSMGKTIADMLQTGSAGLASAVPGLSIALSAIDTAIGVYNLIKAKTSESFVKDQLKKNKFEMFGTFEKGKKGRSEKDKYLKFFEEDLAKMRVKRAGLITEKENLKATGAPTKEVDDKLTLLNDAINLGEEQYASLQENVTLSHLKGVNKDRKYNAGFEIGVNIVKIVGDVLSLVPEPGSQVAGMSLKLIAGGSKVVKGIGSKIIQWGRDKAAGKPDSVLNKMFDSTKSADAVKSRNVGTIKYIFSQVKALPEPANAQFAAKTTIVEQIISSTGCDPKNLYRTISDNGDKGIDKGVQLLFKSLGQ